MHVPNPLGGYPLILRPSDVPNPRNGELLMDYENNDLIYVNRETGNKSSIAMDIYNKIIASRLENSHIKICKNNTSSGEEEDIPNIEDRKMNTMYICIESRSEIIGNNEEEG